MRQPPWEGPESEGISFGTWLRQQREVRQIALREIAEASKVSLRYLEAFEQDRFEVLPAPVFSKGFLRQYADYVGLDADEVVNHYLWAQREGDDDLAEGDVEDQVVAPRGAASRGSAAGGKERPVWLLVLVALLLALVAVAVFLVLSHRKDQAVEEVPRQTFVAPVPPPIPPPPPADEEAEEPAEPAAPLRLTVEFTRDCWVEALVDGQRRIAQEFSQGESLQIEAQEQVVFRKLGNAGGVNIEVNGMPLAIAGTDGQVLSDLVIDLETVAGLGATP